MKIENNFLMVSNYNADISWILDYTDNYIIYDRSDTDEWIKPFDQKKVIKVPNIGWDIYDKFTYIIDNYDNLPETMILTKGNIFKYIAREEFDQVCNNTSFTPLFTKQHKTYMPICFYDKDKMFNEINNSWYLRRFPAKYFSSYNQFIKQLGLETPKYIKFAPGSNYIVTKQNIHKHPKSFYQKLRQMIDYSPHPGEAQIIERFLYTLWTIDKELRPEMLELTPQNLFYRIYQKILSFLIKKMSNDTRTTRNKKGWLTAEETKNYRAKIKIYDIFTYNGEADILEIRLNILKDSVDQFIIVEAPTTFSGLNKPLYFQEQKERFKPFLNKMIYFVIDDYPNDKKICELADSSSNVPQNGPEHWRREFYQKESIKKALTHLKDEDICFIGDVDEIWNPEVLIDYTKDDIFKLRQTVYAYYLNNRSSEPWAGTIVTKYKNIKNSCLNHLRTKGKTKYIYIENGGWHFTSMGGINEVRRKLNDSYTKESYNTEDIQLQLDERFGKKDYMGRSFKFWTDEKDLPKYILDNKEKYKNLFKS
jgi:beta-1,4-mannosyl-glycoprotein beta-1,4-N-acetylglucosaminyltransferase